MRYITDSRVTEKLKRISNYYEVYHRTKKENVEEIAAKGFRPGGGAMYGKGWYFTYDLNSQTRPQMVWYGDALIKAKVNPKNLLIFDYNVSQDVFGKKYTLKDQLIDHYKIYRDIIHIPQDLFNLSDELEETFKDPTFSADRAFNVFVQKYVSNGRSKIKEIYGIVFTGNHDGNVLVSYSYDTAVPVEFALTDATTGDIVDGWQSIKSAGIASKRAAAAEYALDLFQGMVKRINVEKYNLENLQKDFPWLVRAKMRDAIIRVTDDGEIIWEEGDWIKGEWQGDLWLNGQFINGKWTRGTFENGIWEYGNFIDGVFDRGSWRDGIWTGGQWTGRGTWKTGEIKQGTRFVPSTNPPETL